MSFPKGHSVAHTPFICFACGKIALRGKMVQIANGRARLVIVKSCRDAKCIADIKSGKNLPFLKRIKK